MQFFKNAAQEVRRIKSLTGAAMLAALHVVINQLVIPVGNLLEVGFAFLASGVSGYLYGPWLAGIAAIVADIAGYFLRPNGGFFIGFTLNEFIIAFIYGCFFYQKQITKKRAFFAVLTTTVLINLTLTPIWLYIMYGKSFFAMLGIRLIKNAIKLPIDAILLYLVLKTTEKYLKPFKNKKQ